MSNNPKVIVSEAATDVFRTVLTCLANATDRSGGKTSAKEEVRALLQGLWDTAFYHGQSAMMESVNKHMSGILEE